MEKKTFRIWLIILAAVIGALIWLNVSAERGPEPEMVIPMANRNIEWTGAGYDGIYARGNTGK